MPAIAEAIVDIYYQLVAGVLRNPMLLKFVTHLLHPFSSLYINLGTTLHPFLFHECVASFQIFFGMTVVVHLATY